MDSFPTHLTPSRIEEFNKFNITRTTQILRQEIYVFLLKNTTTYFDIGGFFKQYRHSDEEMETILECIVNELKELSWNLALIFGDTGLIITKNLEDNMWRNSLDIKIL